MRINNVIHKPLVTEKSMKLAEDGRYVFKVAKSVTKNKIIKEIENLFDVEVVSVNTMIMPKKVRRVFKKGYYTNLPKWKKAVVQLKKGQKIDLISEGK